MPFDPQHYEEPLSAIIDAIAEIDRNARAPAALDARTIDRILRKHPRDGKGFFSRSQILAGFRHLRATEGTPEETDFARRLRLRPIRTQSGVAPITVLTRPFPCPGRCVFCPNDVRMPKSYLSDEPGAQRAAANDFDPFRQTWSRLAALRAIGHPTDKAELIVLGGTWSAYPESYRRWFVRGCLEAMNAFGGRGPTGRASRAGAVAHGRRIAVGQGPPVDYNRVVRERLRREHASRPTAADGSAEWSDLERAQRANESADTRCVGLCLETRPDCVDVAEVESLRRLGATKVQVGIQSLCDAVLARIGVATTSRRRDARWGCCAAPGSSCTFTGCRTCWAPRPKRTCATPRASSTIRPSARTRSRSTRAVSWRARISSGTGGQGTGVRTRTMSSCAS